jgi:predicted HTH transcriptional regulator
VTVGAKGVVLIDIPEGNEKPYLVRGKGAYIRSGATKRLATRHELDRMYATRDKSRQGPFAGL